MSMPATAARSSRMASSSRAWAPARSMKRRSASSAPTTRKREQQRWRFSTIARAGEPGGETWGPLPELYRAGGETWITGSYDPELNLTYWGTTQAKPWMPVSRGMATRRCGALHEFHGGARRHDRQARVVLPARTRRSVRSRRRLRARAGRCRSRSLGVLRRQGRRALEERSEDRRIHRSRRDRLPEHLGASIRRPASRAIGTTSSTTRSASGSTRARARPAARTGTR